MFTRVMQQPLNKLDEEMYTNMTWLIMTGNQMYYTFDRCSDALNGVIKNDSSNLN